jgi:hypothetical protein
MENPNCVAQGSFDLAGQRGVYWHLLLLVGGALGLGCFSFRLTYGLLCYSVILSTMICISGEPRLLCCANAMAGRGSVCNHLLAEVLGLGASPFALPMAFCAIL